MAKTEELPEQLRTFIEMYAWRRNDPVPWAAAGSRCPSPASACVVMACQTMRDQPPFDTEEPDFDPSIRLIPSDTDPRHAREHLPRPGVRPRRPAGGRRPAHPARPAERDGGVRARSAGSRRRTVSLCGHLPHPQRLIDETAPEIARSSPRTPPTSCCSSPLDRCATRPGVWWPPRSSAQASRPSASSTSARSRRSCARRERCGCPFPLGYALGAPNDPGLQLSVLRQTFALLDEPGPPPVLKDYVREAARPRRAGPVRALRRARPRSPPQHREQALLLLAHPRARRPPRPRTRRARAPPSRYSSMTPGCT